MSGRSPRPGAPQLTRLHDEAALNQRQRVDELGAIPLGAAAVPGERGQRAECWAERALPARRRSGVWRQLLVGALMFPAFPGRAFAFGFPMAIVLCPSNLCSMRCKRSRGLAHGSVQIWRRSRGAHSTGSVPRLRRRRWVILSNASRWRRRRSSAWRRNLMHSAPILTRRLLDRLSLCSRT